MFEVDAKNKTIHAYGEVGVPGDGFVEEDFVSGLAQMGGSDVTIYLQSPGGDVFGGLSIYNQLDRYPGQITIVVDSMAASIASTTVSYTHLTLPTITE
mgnify:CR=1 FL=1